MVKYSQTHILLVFYTKFTRASISTGDGGYAHRRQPAYFCNPKQKNTSQLSFPFPFSPTTTFKIPIFGESCPVVSVWSRYEICSSVLSLYCHIQPLTLKAHISLFLSPPLSPSLSPSTGLETNNQPLQQKSRQSLSWVSLSRGCSIDYGVAKKCES